MLREWLSSQAVHKVPTVNKVPRLTFHLFPVPGYDKKQNTFIKYVSKYVLTAHVGAGAELYKLTSSVPCTQMYNKYLCHFLKQKHVFQLRHILIYHLL